jgi:hypothetical protein
LLLTTSAFLIIKNDVCHAPFNAKKITMPQKYPKF